MIKANTLLLTPLLAPLGSTSHVPGDKNCSASSALAGVFAGVNRET